MEFADKKIKESGIESPHLDTHHRVNILHPINKIFVQLAREHNLPVRNNFKDPNDIKTVNRFNMEFENLAHTKEIWKLLIWEAIQRIWGKTLDENMSRITMIILRIDRLLTMKY